MAEQAIEEGNLLFKNKLYEEASKRYSEALHQDSSPSTLIRVYNNRSQCYLNLVL